jgi:hypothetical protein
MGFTVYFIYPETKGYTLEHIAVLFDREDAVPTSAETAQRACSVTGKDVYSGNLHDEDV